MPAAVYLFLLPSLVSIWLYHYRFFLAGLHYLFGKLHQWVGVVGAGQQVSGKPQNFHLARYAVLRVFLDFESRVRYFLTAVPGLFRYPGFRQLVYIAVCQVERPQRGSQGLYLHIHAFAVGTGGLKGLNYLLPVIALAAYPMAYTTRLAKTSMLDALSQDYIRTAKAKGVSKYKVIFKHALRNSLLPIITYAGPEIAYIITGSMVVETVFTVGGIGSKFVSAITNRDYTMIMATTIFLATLMVVANVICDLLYKVVDPRIKYE